MNVCVCVHQETERKREKEKGEKGSMYHLNNQGKGEKWGIHSGYLS